MDRFGQIAHILRGNARHRNTAVLREVNAELLRQTLALLLIHARETEHADLVGNVRPVARRAQLLQVVAQRGAHGDDTIGHQLHVTEPLLAERFVAQNFGHQPGTVNGRVRVHRSDQDLDLRHRTVGFVLAARDQRERSRALTIQAHVLGEALGQRNLMAIAQELAHRQRILVDVTARKALVGHVEEREQIALLDEGRHLGPLFRFRVDAGWIVGARMQ